MKGMIYKRFAHVRTEVKEENLSKHDGNGNKNVTKQKVHVCYKSLYISLPSLAKQQREMTQSYVFWRKQIFHLFTWNWTLASHI